MTQSDDTLLLALGATLTSLGLATARPRDVMVLESGGCPAPEFAGAFDPGHEQSVAAATEQGKTLERELRQRNILADNRYHIPALIPVLYRHIRDAGLRCLFWTDTLRIEPDGDGEGYTVDFFNASGQQRIHARKILDTTAEGTAGTVPRRWTEKRLWSALHGSAGEEAADSAKAAGIDWKPGRFNNESYFGVRLEPDTEWPAARQQLLEAWRKRPAALAQTRLAAIATEFEYRYPRHPHTVAKNWIHRPSASYAGPLSAFDGGVTLAREEWA